MSINGGKILFHFFFHYKIEDTALVPFRVYRVCGTKLLHC